MSRRMVSGKVCPIDFIKRQEDMVARALHLVLLILVAFNEALAAPSIIDGVDVPLELAVRPAASTCKSLRSATYRVVTPTFGGTSSDQTGEMLLDATRLSISRPDGSTGLWVAQSPCRFLDVGDNGTAVDYVVSQAGVLGGRISVNSGSSYRMLLAFPEQSHKLTELAGTWSLLGLRRGSDGFYADAGSVVIDGAGSVIAATHCGNPINWSTTECSDVPVGEFDHFKFYNADPSAGFVSKTSTRTTRVFLFKAAIGTPMLVAIGSDGALVLGAPAAPGTMSPVGQTAMRWNLDMTSRLASATSIYLSSTVTLSADMQRKAWIRSKRTPGLMDEHTEELLVDQPRPGYFTRPGGATPNSKGVPVRYTELTSLQFLGAGLSASVVPAIKVFEISIFAP